MSILKDIRTGVYDDDLEDMALSIRSRQRTLGVQNFAQIRIHSRVRFVSTIRPTYLRGVEATVIDKKVTKLVVMLDSPVGRFRGQVRVPGSLVEPVDVIDQPGIMRNVTPRGGE